MTGLGMKIGEECWEEGARETRQDIAFRMFSRNDSLEDISDILGISMDYTLELRQEYERKVHEESKYGAE